MRLGLFVVALSACSYHAPDEIGSGVDPGPIDAATDSPPTVDAMAIDVPAALGCDVPDTAGLVLCTELDDAGPTTLTTAVDLSGKGHDAAVVSAAGIVNRDVPVSSQAVQVISTTTIQIAPSADFDTQNFTLLGWVHREGAGGTLIDVGFQYEMLITPAGNLGCIIVQQNIASLAVMAPVTVNEWDAVACTYDGAQLCGIVMHGGSGAGTLNCVPVTKTLNVNRQLGVSLGSELQSDGSHITHLAGKLDSARIFTRVLDAQELCQAAGRTGC